MNKQFISGLQILVLVICGCIMSWMFYLIQSASVDFEQGTSTKARPIISVLAWFWWAFAAYLIAWFVVGGFSRFRRQAGRLKSNAIQLAVVVSFAIVFRIIMTPSVPIQEIDLYRYIWDGAVVSNQLDPYQFGPKTVLDAINDPKLEGQRKGLSEYTAIVKKRPGLKRVLEIVHFGNYTSPYPPVSQAAFGLAVSTVRPTSSARNYVVAMKTMLVVVDFLTGLFIVLLLYHLGMNTSLSLGYWWCPLVIKEVANGGHLDSVATFLAVLAVYFTTSALWNRRRAIDPEPDAKQKPAAPENLTASDLEKNARELEINSPLPGAMMLTGCAAAVALAAAFSAKVFPIVLAPIWFVVMLRRSGVKALVPLVLFIAAAALFSWPMVSHLDVVKNLTTHEVGEDQPAEAVVATNDYADPNGIEAFSKYWEMNDFLFMIVVENIKPMPNPEQVNKQFAPWFAFTGNEFRKQCD